MKEVAIAKAYLQQLKIKEVLLKRRYATLAVNRILKT